VKLIFNAESLRPPITGVGNYSFHLLEQFLNDKRFDEVHCFSGTHWLSGQEQYAATLSLKQQSNSVDPGPGEKLQSGVRALIGAIPGSKSLYSRIMDRRFERTANTLGGAVYHETNYILKPYAGPCITTVHDLSHIRFPQYHHAHVIEWLERGLPATLDRADCIITVSNVIRDELLHYYDVPAEKVHTVYEGVEECYQPRSGQQTASVLSHYGLLHKQYVLLVATLEPRKGIDVLLDAWELLPLALRQAFPLVLTGSSGWRNQAIVTRLERFIAEGTVHHLGYVPDSALPVLFAGAAVFTYPSVYEGFGLPVLDAMRSGVPVICRAGTSMAEFAQGACLLCDTGEAEELATRLQSLLEDPPLREAWAQKGMSRARDFSWQQCAAETAALYRLVA
jgi:alpha-1,3-rhamnosyl/mannosyltransferase